MSTDLKFSLVTTIIVLGLIVAGGLTAALNLITSEGEHSPSVFPLSSSSFLTKS